MSVGQNLLDIPPTLLPVDPAAAKLEEGVHPEQVAAACPTSSLAWAQLAEDALADGLTIQGYAFARTGYHRGLDALRKHGWRGQGPVPWSHEPNRGVLRAFAALTHAAAAIGETDEQQRCAQLLRDSSPEAAGELGL